VPSSMPSDDTTVAGFIAQNPNLTQLNRAVLRAGFDDELSSDAIMLTLFAGSDIAFAAIPESFRFLLFENDEFLPHLRNLITYNALFGEIFEANFTDGQILTTFNGESVTVERNPFRVNGIPITDSDRANSNGVVHIVDDVLTPSWFTSTLLARVQQDSAQDSDLSTTLEFLVSSGVAPDIDLTATGNFTLLAPTNSAWNALPQEMLLLLRNPANETFLQDVIMYHILDGVFTLQELFPSRITTLQGNFVTVSATPRIRFNQARLVNGGRDILANNGVLQKIDSVLNFQEGMLGGDTILDFIAETSDLSIFFGALQRAGFTEALANDTAAFTVFAPSNNAFNDLPQDLRNLLFFANDFIVHLQNLLLYNILPQTIASEDFDNNSDLETANGESVNILTNPLTVNQQLVNSADIIATNGFTDTIDGVLLPSWVSNTLDSRVASDSNLTILSDLFDLTGLIFPAEAFTLLAPTDAAWLALGNETLTFLRSEAGRFELLDILLFHIGSPIFTVDELDVGVIIETFFQGGNTSVVTVTSNNPIGNITFNGAAVLVEPNILARNGVLHKIDAVLNPEDGLL
jgi:transforming growth factor-beta-induced protein